MSKLAVARLFCDILVSEIHNMLASPVSMLRQIARLSICKNREDVSHPLKVMLVSVKFTELFNAVVVTTYYIFVIIKELV